jgi:hypothetical protein
MTADARPFKYPPAPSLTVATQLTSSESVASSIPANTVIVNSAATAASEELRWRHWNEKGKRDHAAFREKLRVVAGIVAALIVVGAVTFWMITVA